jgi:hypothetical protein
MKEEPTGSGATWRKQSVGQVAVLTFCTAAVSLTKPFLLMRLQMSKGCILKMLPGMLPY